MIYLDNITDLQMVYIPREEAATASTPHLFALQRKDYEITENGLTKIRPDVRYDGISGGSISVYVTAATGITPTHLNVSKDGIYVPTGDTVYTGVTVEVHDAAYQEGFDDGYNSGYTVGYNEGYSSGYTSGQTVGYNSGHTVGYREGYSSGSTDGYASGQTVGYNSGHTVGYQEGYSSGRTDGYASGQTAGYNSGYASGKTDGYSSGVTVGYTSGKTAGYNSGYTIGYNSGYSSGITDGYNSGYTEGYNSGYESGYTSGVTYQKSLLTSQTFTSNGIYTKEDGWNSVNVEYPVFSIGFSGIEHNGRYTYDFQQMMGFEGAWNNISFDVAVPQTGGTGVLDSLNVTQNNTSYYPPQGVDGYSAVTVAIDESQVYQDGYNAGYSSGYTSGSTDGFASGYTSGSTDGYSSGITYQKSLLASTAVTSNGTYTRENGYSAVTVNVPFVVTMTQDEYDALQVKDPNIIYLIKD